MKVHIFGLLLVVIMKGQTVFEQEQFDLLRLWILQATKVPEVILAYPNAPRPDTDYMTLNLTRSNRIQRPMDWVIETNPDYVDTDSQVEPYFLVSVQEIEFVWSLHAFSKNPINLVNRLLSWQFSQQGREMLGPLNMFRIGDVQRVPEVVDQHWNERAITELFVRSYVCTGTTEYGTDTVLIGQVPTDTAEMATINFPNMQSPQILGV